MRIVRYFPALGVLLLCCQAFPQAEQRWSAERNVLPEGFGASEAKVVILSDGSINVTFKGGEEGDPQLGGIYYTRSSDQGYSWTKPRLAVELSGVQSVTHELLSDGDNLLVYAGMNRLSRYEVQQFVSVNKGQTWEPSEVVFSNTDPLRGLMAWQKDGRMYLIVLVERPRPEGETEFNFWLARGRASGAYWEPAIQISRFRANRITPPRLIPGDPWPSVLWVQNTIDYQVLENRIGDGITWSIRQLAAPPPFETSVLMDRGIAYRVQTTSNRQLLFNRTDDEAPVTEIVSVIPRELTVPDLTVAWQGKDNYTLPEELRYQLQLDNTDPIKIKDATSQSLTGLINGPHLLSLVALDEASNKQTPATTKRFIVKVPPVPSFTSPRNSDLVNRGDLVAKWEASQNCGEGATVSFSLKVDEGEWSPFEQITSKPVSGLTDGEHVLLLQAKDALGNLSSQPATVRFEVDSTPPVCTAQELPRNWDKIAAELEFEQEPDYKVEFQVTGTDNRTSPDELDYRFTIDKDPPSEPRSVSEKAVISGLADGTHQISFVVIDEAQNVQKEPFVLQFDYNTPPNTRVWIDESGQEPVYRFDARDKNSRPRDLKFRWKVDEQAWTDWTDAVTLSVQALLAQTGHGQHTLYVQAQDGAGNMDPSPARLTVDIDKEPPPPPRSVMVTPREDGGEIQLNWDPVAEPNVIYRIYRSESPTFSKDAFAVELELEKARGFDRPKRLKNNATYYYFVTSVDRSNNESAPVVSEPVQVLGESELNLKRFNEFKADIETKLRSEDYDAVIKLLDAGVPAELVESPDRAPYPAFWKAITGARKTLRDDASNLEGLNSSRTALEDFVFQYGSSELSSEANQTLSQVKSRILWLQTLKFGSYAAIGLAVLIVLLLIFRWNKKRQIPEMPLIQAADVTEGVTPSKEALKDPTVLRRWAEVQTEPNNAENWSRLAFAFHNIQEIENAIQALYKAMEIEPNNTRFHFQMGHFQKEAGKTKEAIRHFERYLQLNPESKKSVEEVKELLAKLKAESGA